MPQVHIRKVGYGVSRDTVSTTLQHYTGMGTVEARHAADEALKGKEVSVYVDDFNSVYELADVLSSLGVECEADDTDGQ
jgi:hypothetical protein